MTRNLMILPRPARRRDPPAGAEAQRPFRLWMTGSLAVVMAAMVPLRTAGAAERDPSMRVMRASRFDVSETLHRIELAARDRGLSVLALLPGAPPVLVLAASIGGTLAVMDEADSQPAMPMSVMVRAALGGGAEVLLVAPRHADAGRYGNDLPGSVADELRALPEVVERALA